MVGGGSSGGGWLVGGGWWWLVAAGRWLVAGGWGCWVLGAGCWVLGAGCWMGAGDPPMTQAETCPRIFVQPKKILRHVSARVMGRTLRSASDAHIYIRSAIRTQRIGKLSSQSRPALAAAAAAVAAGSHCRRHCRHDRLRRHRCRCRLRRCRRRRLRHHLRFRRALPPLEGSFPTRRVLIALLM